jgi:hypothetical protein
VRFRAELERWWPPALSSALLAPLLYGIFEELRSAATRRFPIADVAVLEDGVMHVGRELVGPYSRLYFHHPGPFIYWLLWPAYVISGHSPGALHVAALLANLGCLGLLLYLCSSTRFGALGRPIRFAALALLVNFIGGFVTDAIPSAYPSAFADIWNPVLSLFPFAALTVSCVALALGSRAALVVVVVLHAFVCQSHVGYVPVATAFVLFGLVRWNRAVPSAGRRRVETAAVVVLAVLWSAPLYDALFVSHNFSKIVRFFIHRPAHAPFAAALGHAVRQLQAPVTAALGLVAPEAPTTGTAIAAGLTLAEAALLVAAARRPALRDAAVFAIIGLFGALSSAFALEATLLLYVTLWFGVVGIFGWAVGVAGVLDRIRGVAGRALPENGTPVGALALCALSVAWVDARSIQKVHALYAAFREDPGFAPPMVKALADAAARIAAIRKEPVTLAAGRNDDWGYLAGVVLELEQRQVPLRIDASWSFIFGHSHDYAAPDERTLIVSSMSLGDRLLVASEGGVGLYDGRAPKPGAAPPDLALSRLEVHATTGDVQAMLDAEPPAEGASLDDPRAVRFGDGGWILLGTSGALVESVTLLADGAGRYAIEGSVDGKRFDELARAESVDGSGLRQRVLPLVHPRADPLLRVRLLSSDGGVHVVRSFAIHASRFGVALVGATATKGDARSIVEDRRLADGERWKAGLGAKLIDATSDVTVLLPMEPSNAAELTVRGPAEYAIFGSVDCAAFVPSSSVVTERAGVARRTFRFDDHPGFRCLRITAVEPFGVHTVAEVRPWVVPGAVTVDVGTQAGRAHLGEGWSGDEHDEFRSWAWAVGKRSIVNAALEPGVAYRLAFDAQPFFNGNGGQRVRVGLNGVTLATVPLVAGANEVELRVPAELSQANSRLQFDYALAVSPRDIGESDDSRPLAIRVERITFVPSRDPE